MTFPEIFTYVVSGLKFCPHFFARDQSRHCIYLMKANCLHGSASEREIEEAAQN